MVVLLPSSYDEADHNNKHKTPFSTNTTSSLASNSSKNQVRLDTVISKIIQIVLRARLGSDYYCIQPHTTNHCYLTISPTTLPFDNIQQNGINLLICILYKNTMLEQWRITFDSSSSPSPIVIHDAAATNIPTPTTTTTSLIENNNNNNSNVSTKHSENTDIKLLLQAVYSQTRLLPIHNWLSQNKLNKSDLSFLITPITTNTITDTTKENKNIFSSSSSYCCYSHTDSKEFIQQQQSDLAFSSLSSSIGIHDFITATTTDIHGQLKLQVLYDKQLDKKLSFLSKPSLSSTSALTIKNDTNKHIDTCDKYSKPTATPIFMSKKNNNHSSLLSHSYSLNESKSYNHHVSTTTPVITMRRLSKLSLSALNDDNDEELDSNNNSNLFNNNYSARSDPHHDSQFHPSTTTLHPHHPLSIPISSSPIQYTHHGHSLAYSTSPSTSILSQQQQQPLLRRSSIQYHHGLAGSYEESLLSGRMSTLQPSKPITFHAQIGVLGYGHCKPSLKCPPHRSIYFPAFFYDNHDNTNDNHGEDMSIFNSQQPQQHTSTIPPYVGTIDLTMDEEKKAPSPGYRIPSKGQLQIAIKNPNKHLVKLFLIPYDVSSMPRNTKTFLRQTSYLTTNTTTSSSSSVLKYAIHIQLCRTDKNRVYLYKQIRVVFTNRCMDAREQYRVVCEGPKEPVYAPL